MKPKLTAKVVRGLRTIASLASADLESGALESRNGATSEESTEAESALKYLYSLCDWHNASQKENVK